MSEFLKFNPNGQWELCKAFTLSSKQGGVKADLPQPQVGFRGKQGKMQAVDVNRGTPNLTPIPREDYQHKATAESAAADKGLQNKKLPVKNV